MSASDAVHSVAETREPSFGFWRRSYAMLVKEFIQLRRDRVSFAMIVMIPVMQLLLFGYAINTTPRDLPTAVLLQENSDLARSILAALENTKYFKVTQLPHTEAELDQLLASGKVLFAIEIPANFERSVRRGDKPAMLIIADATDPVAAGSALGALGQVLQTALMHDRAIAETGALPFDIRSHARYNPAGLTQLNIVPGLVCDDRDDPGDAVAAVRLRHQHHAAPSADGGIDPGGKRSGALGAEGAGEYQLLPLHP